VLILQAGHLSQQVQGQTANALAHADTQLRRMPEKLNRIDAKITQAFELGEAMSRVA
jgi:hypothetical protein